MCECVQVHGCPTRCLVSQSIHKQLAQEVQSGGGKTRAFLPIPNVDTQAQQRREGETHRS